MNSIKVSKLDPSVITLRKNKENVFAMPKMMLCKNIEPESIQCGYEPIEAEIDYRTIYKSNIE